MLHISILSLVSLKENSSACQSSFTKRKFFCFAVSLEPNKENNGTVTNAMKDRKLNKIAGDYVL